MDFRALLTDLVKRNFETSWFEFKENWYDPDKLGRYISALSNSAKVVNSDYAYFFWGVRDGDHKVVGTTFDYNIEVNHEPLEHYLLRNMHPSIAFKFHEFDYDGKRVVVLVIPAANNVPTSFKEIRYIRIGSSTESLLRYPEREAELWSALNHKENSIDTIPAEHQKLTFTSLINYYSSKGMDINLNAFKENLGLLTEDGKYNILGQLLSDNSFTSIRVSIFAGTKKSDPLFSVKEFGDMNLLISLDKVLDYGDTFNIPQADERNRKVERKEIMLFDLDSYREAVINAFVHNDWKSGSAPTFTYFSDRIEILSHGPLSPKLTLDEFYKGKSEPVNKKLAKVIAQLHISEQSGRGVPTILNRYGEEAFKFSDRWIQVTIPFNFINVVDYQIAPKQIDASRQIISKPLSDAQIRIIKAIRNNGNITINGICIETMLSDTAVYNNLKKLQNQNIIKRVGSRKNGYWKVVDD